MFVGYRKLSSWRLNPEGNLLRNHGCFNVFLGFKNNGGLEICRQDDEALDREKTNKNTFQTEDSLEHQESKSNYQTEDSLFSAT